MDKLELKPPTVSLGTRSRISCLAKHTVLAPVVRKVDSTIHWINHYPLDSAIGCRNT